MTDTGAPSPPRRSLDLWEDEIPSTDNSFLRIGPAIPIGHAHQEDE